jgi:two-component system OmpR family response regulator
VARILVVDDDPHIREVVSYSLEQAGHEIVEREDGQAGAELAESESFDLVVLDVMMPRMDGLEACRRIRRVSSVPILFLSAKDEEIDRVVGLEVGGDDYLSKPFGARELVARVKAMLRRRELWAEAEKSKPESKALRHGPLELDSVRYEVRWNGALVVLTVTEFGLLETLIGHPGRVYTRAELVEQAYRYEHHITERTIDSHVKRIRRKFNANGAPIETVFGVGYRLGVDPVS